jgi:hypothetical protein
MRRATTHENASEVWAPEALLRIRIARPIMNARPLTSQQQKSNYQARYRDIAARILRDAGVLKVSYYKGPGRAFAIPEKKLVRIKEPTTKRRLFAAAHEAGHVACGHGIRSKRVYVGSMRRPGTRSVSFASTACRCLGSFSAPTSSTSVTRSFWVCVERPRRHSTRASFDGVG